MKIATLILVLLCSANSLFAAMPKHELRSAWVATVWALDWPKSSSMTQQKAEITKMLDYYKSANMNAVSFQIRSRSDAMYKSSYEPWSSDLGAGRGTNPGWDPLAFIIEECHKRGMELHAWVNPYRYETSKGAWTLSTDYRQSHPDWLLDTNVGGSFMSILNPGIDEARAQIVRVCKEIVSNYDLDGFMFDDYFYANGTPTDADYNLYLSKRSSSSQSQGDWRRENVNKMVRDVYNMIQSVKPYVKFGISPAGVAGTIKSVTDKYGVDQLTTISSSDWQYNGIFSDPLAWLSEGTIDFISPQIYWATTHATAPFKPICEWWSKVAKKYGRHFYVSHSHSAISAWSEFATEVNYARSVCSSDANGSVFYSAKYLYNTSPGTSSTPAWLAANVYTKPSLTPAISWKSATDPGKVTNIQRSGNTLTWSGFDNVRYAIYAVPNGVSQQGACDTPDYLIGVSYNSEFAIPTTYQSGYQYAISVYDRYSNEYSPVFMGAIVDNTPATSITAPADGYVTDENGVYLKWNAVSGATYTIQFATDASFTSIAASYKCTSTQCLLGDISGLKYSTKYYWRVVTSKANANDGISESRSITTSAEIIIPDPDYVITKDPATYSPVQGSTLENLWIQSVATGNSPSLEQGNRGFTYLNGRLYVSSRDGSGAAGILKTYNALTGEPLEEIELGSEANTTSGGTTLAYAANDVFTDNANNLCVSNLTINVSTQALTICVIDPTTGDATRWFEYSKSDYPSGRIDHCTVYGDITKKAVVMAALAGATPTYNTCVLRWDVENGEIISTKRINLEEYYPTSAANNGIAPRIKIVDNDLFLLSSSSSDATLYNMDGIMADSFKNNKALAPNGSYAAGVNTFELNDKTFLVYPCGDSSTKYQFNLVNTTSDIQFDAMSKYWTIPAGGLGSVQNVVASALMSSASASDKAQYIWLYVPSNGIAGYKFTYDKSSSVADTQMDYKVWSFGNTVYTSATAERITVYNASGAVVADVVNAQNVNIPDASGVYIVKTIHAGEVSTISILK